MDSFAGSSLAIMVWIRKRGRVLIHFRISCFDSFPPGLLHPVMDKIVAILIEKKAWVPRLYLLAINQYRLRPCHFYFNGIIHCIRLAVPVHTLLLHSTANESNPWSLSEVPEDETSDNERGHLFSLQEATTFTELPQCGIAQVGWFLDATTWKTPEGRVHPTQKSPPFSVSKRDPFLIWWVTPRHQPSLFQPQQNIISYFTEIWFSSLSVLLKKDCPKLPISLPML